MSDTLTIPSLPEIERRIDSCRQELAELKRLWRAATALQKAEKARASRPVVGGKVTTASAGGPGRG